jgi:hypothetical protein
MTASSPRACPAPAHPAGRRHGPPMCGRTGESYVATAAPAPRVMPPRAATRQARTTMPAPSCRAKPAPAMMPLRRIADPPKTGPESAFPRALLHRQGRGGGGVLDAPTRGRQKPFPAPPALGRARPASRSGSRHAARAIRPRAQNAPGNALQALISRPRRLRRPEIPPRPFRTILGPFLALRGASCSAIRAALPMLPPAGGHDLAGSHSLPCCDALPAPPVMAAPPAAFTQKFAPRTPRHNISASKCSGGNFITDWRVK